MQKVNGLILPDETTRPDKLPPVVIDAIEQDGLRLLVARQEWWKMGEPGTTTELWLPTVDFSGEAPDVLMSEFGARKYVIKFMNMKARRLMAAGYRPRLKTQVEEAMMAFATAVDANGRVQ